MDELERLTPDFQPDPERALELTMRKISRRRTVRRGSSALLSLALFGGGLLVAWESFDPASRQPVAGPSVTPPSRLPSPSPSRFCRPARVRSTPGAALVFNDYCVTKTGEAVEIVELQLGGTRMKLFGFPAVFDGYVSRSPPGSPPRYKRVRWASICLVWNRVGEHVLCHTGAQRLAEVERWLLDAPPDPSAAPPEGDPFAFAFQDVGTAVIHHADGRILVTGWTVPHTHRVVIRSEGQAVPAMLIGPVSKLPTRWKLIVANLPHDRLAEYRGFDENGELIWSQVAPSAGIEP